MQEQHPRSRLDHQPLRGLVLGAQSPQQLFFDLPLRDRAGTAFGFPLVRFRSFAWREAHAELHKEISCSLRRTRTRRVEFHASIPCDEIPVTKCEWLRLR